MPSDDERRYRVGHRERELGPFTLRELAERRLTRDMLVWYEGLADWVRIHEIPELRGDVQSARQYPQSGLIAYPVPKIRRFPRPTGDRSKNPTFVGEKEVGAT
jgi:hypothetical protein